jgi:hypothetical protein
MKEVTAILDRLTAERTLIQKIREGSDDFIANLLEETTEIKTEDNWGIEFMTVEVMNGSFLLVKSSYSI